MPEVLTRVKKYMAAQQMPGHEEPLLVAVSGGADSVCLLLLLHRLGYRLAVAHCDHGLRPESAAEALWVQALCDRLAVPCRTRRFTAEDFAGGDRGEGTQHIARKLRYAFFEACMSDLGFAHCATGHHADDQAETLMLSFLRGNSPKLMRPIPAQRGPYLRPLLCLGRAEIEDWLQLQGQDWCHDASNDGTEYQRNRVRNALFPALEQVAPHWRSRFLQQGERYALQQAWMDQHFETLFPYIIKVSEHSQVLDLDECKNRMGAGHESIFVEWWLMRLGMSGTQVQVAAALVQAQAGARADLDDWQVTRLPHGLAVATGVPAVPLPIMLTASHLHGEPIHWAEEIIRIQPVPVPARFVAEAGVESHWLDLTQVRGSLVMRAWQQGDRIQPLGMRGSRLVSDILGEQKAGAHARAQAWVLADDAGVILVAGHRVAARVAIPAGATACLRLDRRQSV